MSKNILVIGGSKGIGRVFANRRVKRGDNVFVFARSFEKRDRNDPKFIKVDLTNKLEYINILKKILNEIKVVDAIVFAQRFRGDEKRWKNELLVSVDALRNIVEISKKHLKKNSSIVIISSNASRYVAIEQPVGYHTAKSAIVQMARYYAVELGKKGIRVNVVSPAITLKPENEDFYNSNLEIKRKFSKVIPFGRMANSDDISNVIDFLISKKSSFITGQTLVVDGGLSLLTKESLIRSLC